MGKKLLVIDSSKANIQRIYNALGDHFEIADFSNFNDAIRLLVKEYRSIALILAGSVDLRQDSYRVVQLMERNTAAGSLPLICMGSEFYESAAARLAAEDEAIEHGAVAFIAPPYDTQRLIKFINNLIQLKAPLPPSSLLSATGVLKNPALISSAGTFWNPESPETLIMNTYVGAACILESIDDRLSILRVNDRFATEILGRDAKDDIGYYENVDKKIEEASLVRLRRTLNHAACSNEDSACELLLKNVNNGKTEHIFIDLKLIDKINNRRLFYCTARNDTEQYESQRRERATTKQLQTIIQNVNGGVAAATVEGDAVRYIFTNEQYFTMFGYTQEGFFRECPKGVFDLIFPEYLPELKARLKESLQTMETVTTDYMAKKRDGSNIWVRSRSTPAHLETIEGPVYITVLVDITAEKSAEERIQTINDKLINSDVYLHLDLINRKIVEYRSVFETDEGIAAAKADGEVYEDKMLVMVYEDNRESVTRNWSYEGLARHYENGNNKLVVEYRRYLPDGAVHWFRTTAILTEGVTAGSVNAFIYAKDVDTEKKIAIARELVVDTEIDGIAITDIATRQSMMVKTGTAFMYDDMEMHKKYSFENNVRFFVDNIVAEEDKLRCKNFFTFENILKAINEQGSADIAYWIILPDGETRRINTHFTYLDETRTDFVMVIRNITALFQKEQEQKLALQKAAIAADEANRAKSEFLARMSHDIRAPMAAILGVAELAERETDLQAIRGHLQTVKFSGKYLLSLVNDTLDLSKIESGSIAFNRAPYPIHEFIKSVNTVMQPLFDAKNIELVLDLEDDVRNIIVDKLRFTQIFFNLLSNAAKYTPAGGRVVFFSEPIPGKDGKVGMRFHIRDNGIGMSEEFQKVIFDPFTQENRPELSERKGTGLGLAIVKRIVDETGGRVEVVSEPGKGSEFIVDLYAYNLENTSPEDIAPKYDPQILEGLRVLVVDDDPINSMILGKLLENKNCSVHMATNGQEGLDVFEASEAGYYDIIITDIRMPVMNGLEEARRIRALDRPDAKSIPIIGTTADVYSDAEDITRVAGINARLVKPIEAEVLYETIAGLIGKS